MKLLKPRIKQEGNRIATIQTGSWRTNTMTSSQRGYNYRWQQARVGWLRKHPLCVYCERDGRVTAAKIVDHIEPHRGDMVKFWDSAHNWQSLCAPCHSSVKAKEEMES